MTAAVAILLATHIVEPQDDREIGSSSHRAI
jgi:hypothetical protein